MTIPTSTPTPEQPVPRKIIGYELWMGYPDMVFHLEDGQRVVMRRTRATDSLVKRIDAKEEVWL